MAKTPVSIAYAARLAELRGALGALDARSSRISTLRGVMFLGAVGLGAARIFAAVPPLVWIAAGAFATAFAVLVVTHAVLVTRMSAIELRITRVERGQKRIAGDIAALPEKGERFLEAGHAYAGDLDVFGPSSLFQLLDVAETGPGEAALGRWLSAPAGADPPKAGGALPTVAGRGAGGPTAGADPPKAGGALPTVAGRGAGGPTAGAEIAARQEAARELADMPRFREDLAAAGAESGTRGRDAEPFLAWAEKGGEGPNRSLMRLGQALAALTVTVMTVTEILGSARLGPIKAVWVVPLLAQLAVLLLLRPAIEPVLAPASSRETPFGRWVALFRLVEGQELRAPRLAAIRDRLVRSAASREIGRLQRILGFAEVRHNGMLAILVNTLLLWDVFCAAWLLRWRARSGGEVRGWIEAVAELEALSCLATFAHEHPDYAFPAVDDGDLHFEAEGLGHPLIPPGRRVENDVTLGGAGSALLVTGSNMSGKSTLLRAVGVNTVLALAGAPVCARRLSTSVCSVRTSMRIKDSLEEGVSHFYAELARLKAIVDAVNGGERVLFLLDEVLHGTNSRERRIGAKAVVLHLLSRGAIGAVSSHDLGLADIETESAGRVRNVHFQELVEGDRMTFDYKLKPGVVTSANALRLMKLIGIAVELPEA